MKPKSNFKTMQPIGMFDKKRTTQKDSKIKYVKYGGRLSLVAFLLVQGLIMKFAMYPVIFALPNKELSTV